jgi:hypothetical protein
MDVDKMINYRKILEIKWPNYSWTIEDDFDYDTLIWNNNEEKPSKELLDNKYSIFLNSEILYIRNQRAINYPSIQNQLDMLYWDRINNTNNWEESITAIKKQFPKPLEEIK